MNRKDAIVITGASTGIGKACALHLDDLGFTVFAGVRKEEDATALRHESSTNFQPIMLDVTETSMIAAAADVVSNNLEGRGLAGLVNNAGIPLGGPLEFLSLSDFRYELEVNLIGAVAVTQSFLPLIRQGHGRIVNISSLSGFIALPFMGPYAATKFALRAITDALRIELRPWGISVSIIEAGDVATQIWEKGLAIIDQAASIVPKHALELYGPIIELRDRFQPHGIPPMEVAKVIEHALTSNRPKARYIIGRDARFFDVIKRLPISVRDWMIASQLPKYG